MYYIRRVLTRVVGADLVFCFFSLVHSFIRSFVASRAGEEEWIKRERGRTNKRVKRRDTSLYRTIDEERETRTEKDAGCCFSVARVRDKSRAERNEKRVRDPACVCMCVCVWTSLSSPLTSSCSTLFCYNILSSPGTTWSRRYHRSVRTNAAGKACEYIYVNLRNSRVSRFALALRLALSLLPPSLPFPFATHTLAPSLTLNLVFFRLRDIACHVWPASLSFSLLPFILLCIPISLSLSHFSLSLSLSPVWPSLFLSLIMSVLPLPFVQSPFRCIFPPVDGSSSVCTGESWIFAAVASCCAHAARRRQRKTSRRGWQRAPVAVKRGRTLPPLRLHWRALSRVVYPFLRNLCMRSAIRSGRGENVREWARTSERGGVGDARREKNNTGQDVTRTTWCPRGAKRACGLHLRQFFCAFPASFRSPQKPPPLPSLEEEGCTSGRTARRLYFFFLRACNFRSTRIAT